MESPVHTRKHIVRFSFVFLFMIGCLLAFSVKLVLIQVFKSSHLAHLAEEQHNHFIEIEPIRGTIYDRRLKPMAFNVSVYSLYANPRMMTKEDKDHAVIQLSQILKKDPAALRQKLEKDKFFVWVERKLPLDIMETVKERKINGLGFRRESKRYYPNGTLAAHIIGFAGVDNKGLEGIELFYNDILQGEPGQVRVLRDAKQRELMIERSFIPPRHGQDIVLTIDETIQYIAERALEKTFVKYKAKAATIIVLDHKTGEILALANQPTYNLDKFSRSSVESRTNRAVSFVYEPGSIFKIVTAAAALEEDIFSEDNMIFCENGKYRVGNHILHDHHPHGRLTFQEVFELSSNIGVTKIAQKLGPDLIYKYAKRFHFGQKTGIDLKGEVSGILKHPRVWSKTTIGAIPIGHEVTATPLQLVSAMGAIANKGVLVKPFVVKSFKDSREETVKEFSPRVVDRVISEGTARRLKEILVGVTERGTAKRARIRGMRVAGKTGTAQKVVDGKYSHRKFYASFMGFAPADNPRLTAIVVFDEPYPSHFGGTVAAPVFKEVLENALRYLDNTGNARPDTSGKERTIKDFL